MVTPRNSGHTADTVAQSPLSDLVLRYLSCERDYHLELLQLIRQLGGNGLSSQLQPHIEALSSRRDAVSVLREELLGAFQRETGRDDHAPISEIILSCSEAAQPELKSHAQQVRALVIQTRMATERIGRRLTLMHDCLEEVLTGNRPSKSTSYDRAGRLRSRSSSRSLLTRRG